MNDSRWISVKERLPEIKEGDDSIRVIATWTYQGYSIINVSELTFSNDLESLWVDDDGPNEGFCDWIEDGYERVEAIAWMPLPEPYKEESNDKY